MPRVVTCGRGNVLRGDVSRVIMVMCHVLSWFNSCLIPGDVSRVVMVRAASRTLKTTKNGKQLEKTFKNGKNVENFEKNLKNDNFKQRCKNYL